MPRTTQNRVDCVCARVCKCTNTCVHALACAGTRVRALFGYFFFCLFYFFSVCLSVSISFLLLSLSLEFFVIMFEGGHVWVSEQEAGWVGR